MITPAPRKRIALIVPGGLGTGPDNMGIPVLEQQVKLLSKEFEIAVFSLFKVNADYKTEGFEIISISAPSFISKAVRLFRSFRSAHRKKQFDVVHGMWASPCGFLAVLIGKYFGVTSFVSVLGGDAVSLPFIGYGQLRSPLQKAIVRWTLYEANAVVALTRYLVGNLEREKIIRSDIRVIPWGVDQDVFAFTPRVVAPPVKFLHVANLSGVKDQITLLKAFQLIAQKIDSELTIIGEGPKKIELEEYIATHKLKVVIKPAVLYHSLPAFYQEAMILLHTSLSEGQSEVVTEAMSSGLVVCGTRVGLLYDLPECCVAVNVGDHQALADGVIKLIHDSEAIALLQQRAREWTQAHSIHWSVERIAELYRNLS